MERVGLTTDRLEALARIPHVRKMVPIVEGGAVATLGNRPEQASVSSGAGEDPEFRKRVVVGRGFESEDERSVLLSEWFAYRIGLVDDAAPFDTHVVAQGVRSTSPPAWHWTRTFALLRLHPGMSRPQ